MIFDQSGIFKFHVREALVEEAFNLHCGPFLFGAKLAKILGYEWTSPRRRRHGRTGQTFPRLHVLLVVKNEQL